MHERTLRGDEADRRRAVSALYYALFHRLCATGAAIFATGGPQLQLKSARAFNHGPMAQVCTLYVASGRRGQFVSELAWHPAGSPSAGIVAVASAFIQLQQARHLADYDLAAELSAVEHLHLLFIAENAHWQLDRMQGADELMILVSTMLLHDRWKRNG